MGNTNTTIEINGKRYDSTSGSVLGSNTTLTGSKQHAQTSRAKSIDGFMRVSRGSAVTSLQPHTSPSTNSAYSAFKNSKQPADIQPARPSQIQSVESAVVERKSHQPGITVSPHAPQRATTLMRSAVKKPVIKAPTIIKAQTRTDLLTTSSMQTVVPKASVQAINVIRNRRAERMIKSSAVSRYSRTMAAATPTTGFSITAALASKARPAHGTPNSFTSDISQRPEQAQQSSMQFPASNRLLQNSPAHQVAQLNSKMTNPSLADPELDIFEQALADATSHEQTYNHPQRRSGKRHMLLRFATGGLVALLLLGFLAYHSSAALSLKLASYKSGIHATLPASDPSGFALGYLASEPGNVTANFTSSDSRQFNITQKASSWDSQALLNNFVSDANSAYKTYQRAGRTVYLLSNNTATWVDSGIWYTVDGNSNLSSTQLLDLATSM